MKTSIVTVGPVTEAVTLAEAKAQLRIDPTDGTYDLEIKRQMKAATQWVERRYGISLITQTRKQRQDQLYDRYPIYRNFLGPYYSRYPVTLLYPPVQSVTTFKYYDTSQVQQDLVENTDFTVAGKMTPTAGAQDIEIPRIWPTSSWPSYKWMPDTIEIIYVSGFGPDSTYVPDPIRQAVLMCMTHFFENRMEEVDGRISKFEMNIDRVMSTYEVFDTAGVYA